MERARVHFPLLTIGDSFSWVYASGDDEQIKRLKDYYVGFKEGIWHSLRRHTEAAESFIDLLVGQQLNQK